MHRALFLFALSLLFLLQPDSLYSKESDGSKKEIAYIVSDLRIPFWEIMSRGVRAKASELGYKVTFYSSENSSKKEMESLSNAIKSGASGLIISPTNSSACKTMLKIAKQANVPVVISDIGTDGGEYVSYISSDNFEGAYQIGKVLAKEMLKKGWQNGKVGIVAIPQKRLNGKARTAGFMKAMDEANIKSADIKQQTEWSEEETYRFAKEMIAANKDLRAIWLQGSDRYMGALNAIAESGRKGEILLLTFDAEPEFLELIPKGVILGSAMQQPYLMGAEAMSVLAAHLKGKKVLKSVKMPILAISAENIKQKLPTIKKTVLGIENR